jgi:hypothetical protein
VIGLDGSVVAINSAILNDFTGSNLGMPGAEALRLLQPSPDATGQNSIRAGMNPAPASPAL